MVARGIRECHCKFPWCGRCCWGISLQVVKRIVRWRWVADGSAVLLGNAIELSTAALCDWGTPAEVPKRIVMVGSRGRRVVDDAAMLFGNQYRN